MGVIAAGLAVGVPDGAVGVVGATGADGEDVLAAADVPQSHTFFSARNITSNIDID